MWRFLVRSVQRKALVVRQIKSIAITQSRYHFLRVQPPTITHDVRLFASNAEAGSSIDDIDEAIDNASYESVYSGWEFCRSREEDLFSSSAVFSDFYGNDDGSIAGDLQNCTNASQVFAYCDGRNLSMRQCLEALATLTQVSTHGISMDTKPMVSIMHRIENLYADATAKELILCLVYLHQLNLCSNESLVAKIVMKIRNAIRLGMCITCIRIHMQIGFTVESLTLNI